MQLYLKTDLKSEKQRRWTVLLVALALYVITLAPTVLWGDDAAFQRHIYTFEINLSPQGHPLWTVVARPFLYLPIGDVAYRANLVSAVFGALTLLLVYVITGYLADRNPCADRNPTDSVPARLLATAVLAFSHTFWLHSVRAEVYTLNTFFFTAVWLALLKWNEEGKWRWLLLAAVTWLVSLGNHLLMTTALPGYLFLAVPRMRISESANQRISESANRRISESADRRIGIRRILRRRSARRWMLRIGIRALAAISAAGLALLLFLLPPLRTIMVGAWQAVWPPRFTPRLFLLGAGFLAYNLMLSTLVALAGWAQLWRRARCHAVAIALFVLANSAFALIFAVPDVYVFYLPSYVALAVACAPGLVSGWPVSALAQRGGGRRWFVLAWLLLILPSATYRVTPLILNRLDVHLLPVRDLPGRDAETFFLWPPKTGYRGAREYGEAALNSVPPGALILADATPRKTMWYLQRVEGMRPDVLVTDQPFGEGAQVPFLVEQSITRPVFLADVQAYYDVAEIEEHFEILPFGPIYEIRPRHNP